MASNQAGQGNPGGGDTYIHPVAGYNSNPRGWDGGVADHSAPGRAMGNWQSDNAVDCMCPDGTPILAVADGTVGRVTPDTSYNPADNPNGDSLYLTCSGCEFWYTHMQKMFVQEGDKVSQGDRIGSSGSANSVAHLHFAANPSNPPPANNPENVVSGGNIADGGSTPPGGGGSGSAGIGFSNGDIFAAMRAAAFSTQFEIPGLADTFSQLFSGDKSIYNDQPLLPFIEQLCGASFRQFQSLPDGTFFAFFPDYFGAYGHRKPYWNIDDVEIIDGQIELTDENLATHVFVAGDVIPDGTIDWSEAVRSKGVITIFDAFNSETIVAEGEKGEKPKKKEEDEREQTQFARLNARIDALDFLRRYGIRPYYEAPSFIQNPYFEVFYAYITFQLMWAKQFLTTFTLTFMPELYPGGIVAFEKYGFQTYVDSVSHSFSYEHGFTTQANLMAPSSLGSDDPTFSRGMILANKTRDPTK